MSIRLTLNILLIGDHRGRRRTRDSGTRVEKRAATTKGCLHVPRQFVKGHLLVPPEWARVVSVSSTGISGAALRHYNVLEVASVLDGTTFWSSCCFDDADWLRYGPNTMGVGTFISYR